MIKYRNNLVGKKFGELTVKEFSHLDKWKKTHWKCECSCGKEKIVRRESLIREHTKTCGDRDIHFTKNKARNWRGVGEIGLSYFNDLKRNCRGFEFNISIEYVWELFLKQNKKCALSNLDIRFGNCKDDNEATASLDRIDSRKGYIEGNVQWVYKEINFMKGNMRQEKFIEFCRQISDHNKP
jgi:hypothetical protein